ncbi:DUF6297 family protein [Salininema proteolyticum]|uniref:DUF6297 family protein n=1 Tax=Salininema proteolyticum TaxID=1607685 RepID=A0ABV8U0A7_9ACTN
MSAEATAANTSAVLSFLREVRAERRAEKRKSAMFALYVLALVGAVWGVPLLRGALRIGSEIGLGVHSRTLVDTLPLWSPALMALATLLIARTGAWRGPVVLDGASVAWILPQPISRGPFLVPRFVASAGLSALLGTLLGVAAGYLVAEDSSRSVLLVAGAGAWVGLGTALAGTALSAFWVRFPGFPTPRQMALLWCGVTALGVLPFAALLWNLPPWVYTASTWLTPWGWASQPLTAAATGGAPLWPVAMGLWSIAVAAVVLIAVRLIPDIPQEALRLRATLAERLTASIFAMDLRQARSSMRASRRDGLRSSRWPAPPRSRWLVVPWRDLVALLRAPGRLVWGSAWCAVSIAVSALAPTRSGYGPLILAFVGVCLLYLAAAQLVEPARLDSDDMRRSGFLPYSSGSLALRHGIVPLCWLFALWVLGGAAAIALGMAAPGLLVLLTALPGAVGTALVSAYRGQPSFDLLVGAETAMGNTGPMQAAFWYLRGPLTLALFVVPPVAVANALGSVGPYSTAWVLFVDALLLFWAWWTARKLYRS